MQRKRSLTVFVPALNEELHLEATVDVVIRALRATCDDYEVVIVNDGSIDRTNVIADRLAAENPAIKVIHHQVRKGLGSGYKAAVTKAEKAFFVFIPGDNSWPYESVLQLFGCIGKAEVVTSYPTNSKDERSGTRQILSTGYVRLINVLHGLKMRYYNGLTIYPTEFLRAHPVRGTGFGFAAELLLTAIYTNVSVIEIGLPIQERAGGPSKAVTARNIASVAKSLLRGFWRLKIRGARLRSSATNSMN